MLVLKIILLLQNVFYPIDDLVLINLPAIIPPGYGDILQEMGPLG